MKPSHTPQAVVVVADALRGELPEAVRFERARNIVQALADENEYSPAIRAFRREEIVREALVCWKLAPPGWFATRDVQARVLQALSSCESE